MSKLPRTTYRLELEGRDDTPEVTPILADVLRAELEGPRHGITSPTTQSVHTTVLWLWSASVRLGYFDGDFRAFKTELTNFEVVKATGAEVQAVPPTLPAESRSDSPAASDTRPTRPRGSSSSRATGKRATTKRSSS